MEQEVFSPARAKEEILPEKDRFCGECCWLFGEDPYGYGMCPHRFGELQRCSDRCFVPEKYVSIKDMRHYQALLLQENRCLRDPRVPPIYRMPDRNELGKASAFAYHFIKIFSEI